MKQTNTGFNTQLKSNGEFEKNLAEYNKKAAWLHNAISICAAVMMGEELPSEEFIMQVFETDANMASELLGHLKHYKH